MSTAKVVAATNKVSKRSNDFFIGLVLECITDYLDKNNKKSRKSKFSAFLYAVNQSD
jgi:hypothetical protein